MIDSSPGTQPSRNPADIQLAAELIGTMTPDTFATRFESFCEFVADAGDHHRDCQHPGPLIIAGLTFNPARDSIKSITEPDIIEAHPLELRLEKPQFLDDSDVIAMVQAHHTLDTPQQIQGALIEQLRVQANLLMLFEQFNGNHRPNPDPQFPNQGTPTEQDLEQLFDDLFRMIDGIDRQRPNTARNMPGQPARPPEESYPAEAVEDLTFDDDTVQCDHCSAVYNRDELDEAIQCCPTDISIDDSNTD